ncbi:MAG TPA: flippase-like domain-containing protein [Gammaproteobacteria bacterium]|nr:hypothetical protein BMS3Abin11_00215 [bacterium BMS3Abin11]GMT40229.1 MAG: hypothetical protein IEMM0001_0964 [bacterium]HDH15390.1 flippase-like domain-containing protein [Gammaproteobacteria bacterium]HDZ79437.1 flippase-like domain-containing protein [Gammaproteobacteria bacterium]
MQNSNRRNAAALSGHSWRWHILVSMGASVLILYLLWWLVSSGNQTEDVTLFKNVLRDTVWWLVSIYIITSILQTLFRALRYRSLLKADGINTIPGTSYMFLITLARNMFVDMVPARIGEVSYILMLNRGYYIPVPACLSTLFISIVLDILALAVILIAIVLGAMVSTSQFEISVGNALVATSLIVLISVLIIFSAVPLSQWFSRLMDFTRIKILQRFGKFLLEVGMSIRRVQQREILSLTLSQSLAIRILKYGGLYILFIAVTMVSFNEFALLPWWQVLPAFISAEAAASLPLPTFMSFGTYEGGGMLAFSVLGFAAADILMVMFVIHLISQVVDYTLGGLGLMGFFLVTGKDKRKG